MKREFIPPMLLREVKTLPDSPAYGYEPKFDGYRMQAATSPQGTWLTSRGGHDFTDRYPAVVQQLPAALGGHSVTLDGEMVGLDETGRESFRELSRKHPRVVYLPFDLLTVDDEPIMSRPLRERRERLERIFVPQPKINLVPVYDDRDALLQAAIEQRMEGVVAKNLNSIYKPGVRSWDWLKQILIRHTDGFRR